MAVLFERLAVLRFVAVELGALEQHRANAARLRAVRILVGFDLGVMLTMDGHPLLRDHAGGEPQPKTKEMADGRTEIEGAMGLCAMQENRDARDRDMSHRQRNDDITPPRQRHQAVRGKVEKIKWHGKSLGKGLQQ